ncbi:Glycosyltransferase involved in cell wall bisynthesis [Desemzia incerta]|uniref:Glycosyltransferase involved in cell wall bisynthesis n=1 Tax=Desemzia incerta TaxID=82801 RepID=A0A1I5X5M4_9LACT|nr:glycosyltransferase [Desemzia incerta]SFQ27299.1 Glycosyltransferase involved in cell wall bisynthesis [Desemzia incerta]
MKLKVGYLIVREEIFSPIVKTQVIDILKSVNREKYEIVLLWACRLDYMFKKKEEFNKVAAYLESYNIKVIRIPVLVLKFPLSKTQIHFLKMQLIYRLKKIIRINNINIIHARGYNAGYIAAKICETENSVKSVFDARSPYLTEINSTYKVKKHSKKYKTWEEIEKIILKKSDVSIATTHNFQDYLAKNSNNTIVIPNNAEVKSESQMTKLCNAQSRKSICYVGSIGYGWNDIRVYAAFTKKIIEKFPDINFEYYVMAQNINTVKKEFNKIGIPKDRYMVKNESPEKLHKKIAGCLCGLQIMARPDVRMGIKTVDYLSSGVPIICNKNAIGGKEVVDEHGVGVSFNDEIDLNVFNFIEKQLKGNSGMATKCLKVAEKNFSTKNVSKMYENLYSNLFQ